MKIRKLMYDSFYSNNEAFSGVTSVDSLTEDLYFHFTDLNDSKWRLSGNTTDLASGRILEDSDTTAITVTPSTTVMHSGETQQITVVNQDGVNVLSECTFSALTNVVIVSSTGLITSLISGTTTVRVTHNDGPTGTTVVTSYWAGGVTLSPSVNNTPAQIVSGYTGTTLQFSLITADGHNVTTAASYVVTNTAVATVGLNTGLLTFGSGVTNLTASAVTTLTATYGDYVPATTVTNFFPVTSIVVTPAAWTGTTTGETKQLVVVNENGYNVIANCTFVSSATSVATVSASGLVTFTGNNGNVAITATYRPIPSITGTPTTSWVGTMA